MIFLLRALMITLLLLISAGFSIVYCEHTIWRGDWPWIWPEPWTDHVFKWSDVEEHVMLDTISAFSYSTLVLFAGCGIGFRIHRWVVRHRG